MILNNFYVKLMISYFKYKFSFNVLLLLSAILITLPLNNIFVSIAVIIFIATTIIVYHKNKINHKKEIVLPMSLFILMCSSYFWSENQQLTLFGIQKESPLFFIPFAFLFLPKLTKIEVTKIIRLFSFGMFVYCTFFVLKAFLNYLQTKNIDFFFYNNLVTQDPGAVYISVFTSFAIFYFIQHQNKKWFEKIILFCLVVFAFLLSSKSSITIDFIIIICYYAFFAKIPLTTKVTTVFSVSLFLFGSLYFVREVRQRFLTEYQTAFVDNTLNNDYLLQRGKVYNVSLNEAWSKKDFHQNNYFPGTALRVYQARIFKELMLEKNIVFTGFGLEASQDAIIAKAKQHNLFFDYGNFNFHNQYLQTFAEIGVFGFIILIAMLYFNLKSGWNRKDFLHIAFAITMIMLFLSESFFCRQRGVVFFITLYCIFNSIADVENEKSKQ